MSAFKKLFSDLVNADGDSTKLFKDASAGKPNIKVFVKETSPYFLVSDSFFYVPAYFTQGALDEFKKKNPSRQLGDLTEKVMLITKWSLELKRVDSDQVFTSYYGLEVRLIVHAFQPRLDEELHPARYPINLYRDDEFKTAIQHFRHRSIQQSLASCSADASKPVVEGKDDWHFKEGSTKVALLNTVRSKSVNAGSAKVKGGAAAKRDAKSNNKAKKAVATVVSSKVAKFTPSLPKKAATPAKGKKSAGKISSGKKALPTPNAQQSPGTKPSMQTFKQFLAHRSQSGAKRSAGKISKK